MAVHRDKSQQLVMTGSVDEMWARKGTLGPIATARHAPPRQDAQADAQEERAGRSERAAGAVLGRRVRGHWVLIASAELAPGSSSGAM